MDPNNRNGKEREKRKTVQEKFVVYSNKAKGIGEGRGGSENTRKSSLQLSSRKRRTKRRGRYVKHHVYIFCV